MGLIRDHSGKFQKGSSGRPKGAKNKVPSRKKLIQLLDTIVDDLLENYQTLNKHDKIRILQHSIRLYEDKKLDISDFIEGGLTFDFIRPDE